MRFDLRQCVRVATACVLTALFAVPSNLFAQAVNHVVSPAELQGELLKASQQRQQNLEQVRNFLSTERAQNALRAAHMDPQQVTKAVPSLSDAELARLASRAQKAQADFAAGTLDNRDLLLIIVAIAALILIIVAVR